MQFRVVILDVLPNEIGKGHDGFEKMSKLLADEASRGWRLKQVDSSWAQGYMIYTIILEKPEAGDEPAPIETKSANGPVNASLTAPEEEPKISPEVKKEDVTHISSQAGANGLSWLASGVGVGVGIFLILLGLITTITISNAIALGRTSSDGFIFPEAAFAVGIVVLVFSTYKIGNLAKRQRY